MEQHYQKLNRSTLKDLLAVQRQVTSKKLKNTLIAELMESDCASNSSLGGSEDSDFQCE
ncbi:Hypothetical predicted protein, partial [Pelobates cultripes]